MTEGLIEIGLDIGHCRVGRLMRRNGVSAVKALQYKIMTDGNYNFDIAATLRRINQATNEPATLCNFGGAKVGFTLL